MKFVEEKTTGIAGITLIQHQVDLLEEKPADGFQIWADPYGVRFKGTSQHFCDAVDLELLAKAIDKAARFYLQHRPKITNLAGH
jgi:hypothetical protein